MNEEAFQYLTGTTDNGNAINFNVETGGKTLAAVFERIVQPVEVNIEVKQGHNIEVYIAYDSGKFSPIGRATRGINRIAIDTDVKDDNYPRCQTMRLAFREFSKAQLILGRVSVLYYELGDVEDQRL